ncbi:hypothetical protein ACFQV2_02895 [Actinokineospora soli]|uniref:Uncharacterized protein n=1 Tax=Actinokineospora soli TaxID=1048753 RepID=A0ABW2TH44_9PSEU
MADHEIPLVSAYQGGKPPETVAVWETQIREAGSLEAARLQVAYLQLLQLRTIKRILIWTLVIIPMIAALIWMINYSVAGIR